MEAVTTPTGRRALGIALAVVSATSFGVMPVLTKVVYDDGADPIGVLAVRFAIAAAVLLVLAGLRGEVLPRGRVLGQLVALGGIGYTAQSITYFFALERVAAGLATLLLYLYPALVVVLLAVVVKDRPRSAAIVCVGLATLGTAMTIGPVQGGQILGVLFGLGSALAYACYVVAGSRVRGVGPLATAAVVMSACATVYAVLALATRPQLPSTASAWWALLGVALIGTVVAVAAFFAALALLGPADTSVVSAFEPVVSVAVAALVLGERLGPVQVLGGAVVLLAVCVLARLRPLPEPAAPA